jgi:glycosyltransferase involved in cell wall biosynthesis
MRTLENVFFVVGNGPSVEKDVLDSIPDGCWIGMNAAYKYWDEKGKYPRYYSCLDPVVVLQHAKEIVRMLNDNIIEEFFLHEAIIEAYPQLQDEPRVTFRDKFVADSGIIPVSLLSRYKQTTGVLATRFCIERGHQRLCLLGIDCNYVEQISEAVTGKQYELVVNQDVARNPNYFFDNYQEKNEKYQVPNPTVHSGNLHLQSFITLKQDIATSKQPIEIMVGVRESLLSKFNLFPFLDIRQHLGMRKLEAIAVPLIPHELDGFLERLETWLDPKFQPSFSHVKGVVLHLFLSCAKQQELQQKIDDTIQGLPWLSHYFAEVRVTYLDLASEVDYYIKGSSLNVFCNKSGPNVFFLTMMAACRNYRNTFLMEADCLPVRTGWLDALEQAATDCPPGTWIIGANYAGPTMVEESNSYHINGNAIYATGDRSFQDYLSGDFLKSLQCLISHVSNSIAYDCAFTQAMHNYPKLIENAGIDMRQYARRYLLSAVITNLGAQLETADESIIDILSLIKSDPNMYIGHGIPFLKTVKSKIEFFDSFFSGNSNNISEIRIHHLASGSKYFQWKDRGFGLIEGVDHSKSADKLKAVRMSSTVSIAEYPAGINRLHFKLGSRLSLKNVTVQAKDNENKLFFIDHNCIEHVECHTIEAALGGLVTDNISELVFNVDLEINQGDDEVLITGHRFIYFPFQETVAPVNVIPVCPEARKVENNWKKWILSGQEINNEKYGFFNRTANRNTPVLKEILSQTKPDYIDGTVLLTLDKPLSFRFRLQVKPIIGAADEIVVDITLRADINCDLEFSAKVFGAAAVVKKATLLAGVDKVLRLNFNIILEKGTEFFLNLKTHSPHQKGLLIIRELRVIKSPQDNPLLPQTASFARTVSINPDAESFFGHFLNYEGRLGKAIRTRGSEHLIAGPVDAETTVYTAHPEMAKVFSVRTNKLYAKTAGDLVADMPTFAEELDSYLTTLDTESKTLVFMYCGSLEIAECFHEMANKYPSCTFAISLYYLSWLDLKDPNTVAYWSPRLKNLAEHPRLRLIVPSEELYCELQEGFGITSEILPHPSTTFDDADVNTLGADKAEKEKNANKGDHPVTIVFPGNLRGGKGYELTSIAISELLKTKDTPFRIRLRFPPDDSVNKARRAFFDGIRERVEVMDSYLDEQSFRDLLVSADLVVLPYTADRFGNRTSGLLIDSLLLGIPCVVIEKTWLARTMDKYNFGLISPEDGASLAVNILKGLEKITQYSQAAIAARDHYLKENSWQALVGFLNREKELNTHMVTTQSPTKHEIKEMAISHSPLITKVSSDKNNRRLLIIGNGPSTKILADAGLHNLPEDMDTFGTTTAYRYFEKINWWPTYYALADRKVVFNHRENFARLLEDPKCTTKKFFLSWPIADSERLEVIAHSSTGSFSLNKAVELGYREIYLIGMEGAYVEEIKESRTLSETEIATLGFGVLNLSQAESKLRIITVTPTENPNYFFPGYQQEGDIYSLPQAHTHQMNWQNVADEVHKSGANVYNLSPISKIDAFERTKIHDIFGFIDNNCWDDFPDPFSDINNSPKRWLSSFSFITSENFTTLANNKWQLDGTAPINCSWKAVSESNKIMVDSVVAGCVTLTSDHSITLRVSLARHDNTVYEGSNQLVKLTANSPDTVIIKRKFSTAHNAVRLQIDLVEIDNGNLAELTIDNITIVESLTNINTKTPNATMNFAEANKKLRDGDYHAALCAYLFLSKKRPFKMYADNAIMAAHKLGMKWVDSLEHINLVMETGIWIIANGAMKSGSTWLFQLFNHTKIPARIPAEFQDPGWNNQSVQQKSLKAAAETLAATGEYYATKQHWRNKNSNLMAYDNIRILNIVRDIRDVIVSRYHHDVRKFGFEGNIQKFLDEKLDFLIEENLEYHSYWIGAPELNHRSYYITSYEYMLTEYEKACRELFDFAGLPLTAEQFDSTLSKNLFENKSLKGHGEFFRKGKALAFLDDLTPAQADRILECAARNGYKTIKQKIADFNPVLVPYLQKTDLGL